MNRDLFKQPHILQDIVQFMRDGICQMPPEELENPEGRLEFVMYDRHLEAEIVDAEVVSAVCFLESIESADDRFEDLDQTYAAMEQYFQEGLQLAIKIWGHPKWSGEGEFEGLTELPYMMGGAAWEIENKDHVVLGWEHQDQELPLLFWIRWFKNTGEI